MELFKKFNDFITEKNEALNESNITGKADEAADVFMKFINRKTKKAFIKYPFAETFTKEGTPYTGIRYYSDKDGSSIRVNNNNKLGGLIHSISFWEAKSGSKDTPDWEIESPSVPLIKLLNDIVGFIMKPKALQVALKESVEEINEMRKLKLNSSEIQEVESLLSQGMSAKDVEEQTGIPYKQILLVRKGVKETQDEDPKVKKNEMTLQDKVLYHETMMEDVYDLSTAVANGAFNSLFISGRAGTGKTFHVERALTDAGLVQDYDFFYVTGSISTVELFRKLHQFRDKILVFDDADAVFAAEDGRNILKAALDSKAIRKISYFKKSKSLYDPMQFVDDPEGEQDEIDAGRIPQQFEFTGRVIFISNLKKEKADPDGAIRSRSILVDVNPDDATLVGVMEKLLPFLEPADMAIEEKKEVFEFVKSAGNVSMRTFVKAAGFRSAGMKNWKRLADRYI